jgi:hypothetical protein
VIIENLAELLYASDAPLIPWQKALPEDHRLYISTAEVVVDLIVQYLQDEDPKFDGSLRLAAQLLSNDAELSRLKRQRSLV